MNPFWSSIIGGASSLLGGIGNSISQIFANRQNRQFSREMYERTMADNIRLWNMQNEYNTPQAQMKRFQEAGLNPHLIYGQGNSGPAGTISTPDVQPAQARSADWGGALSSAGMHMANFYDFRIKQAQAKNLEAQNSVLLQDAIYKGAQTEQVLASTARSKFDLGFLTEMRDVNADALRTNLLKVKQSMQLDVNADARAAAQNSTSIQEAFYRMKNLSATTAHTRADIGRIKIDNERVNENIKLLKQQGVINDLNIKLQQAGINPNDPTWVRVVGRLLTEVYESDLKGKSIWKALFGQ